MTEKPNLNEQKQLQFCIPTQTQSSKYFSKVRSQKKSKDILKQELSNAAGSNGLDFTEIDTISLIPIPTSSENSLQVTQQQQSFICNVIPEDSDKKEKIKPKQATVISNGRTWKYTTIARAQPRRPLHPDISESSSDSEVKETVNSSTTDSTKEHKEIEKFAVCNECGQLSTDFEKCDVCNFIFSSATKTFSRASFKEADILKRKVPSPSPQKTTSELSKQSFYGSKFHEQFQVYSNGTLNTTPHSYKVFVMSSTPAVTSRKTRVSKAKLQEPECLTISSDEEENNSSQVETAADPESTTVTNRLEQGEVCLPDSTTGAENENVTGRKSLSPYDSMDEDFIEKEEETSIHNIILKCRSVRIGSFKVQPAAGFSIAVYINSQELMFDVPTVVDRNDIVRITLSPDDICKVLGHFGNTLPVLYIYTTPACGSNIRSTLLMTSQVGAFYDPSGADETQKRITILPESISNCQKSFFRQVFPGKLLQEIDQKNANEILVRSTPHNQHLMKTTPITIITPILTRSQTATIQTTYNVPKKPVTKLLTYPPPPQTGGITITSEDLECLKAGEFLNDVIIDFYLKYLVMEKLSPIERQRTHIFSSFFYPRLTQKGNTRSNADDDPSKTQKTKRHSHVKTWTRHVDIFEKDFIIIPINQNAHWFLAIVCFPGLVPEKKSAAANFGDSLVGEMEPSPAPSPSLSPAPSPLQKFSQASSPATYKNQHNIGTVDEECQTPQSKLNEEMEEECPMDSESPLPSKDKITDTQETSEEPVPHNTESEETEIEKPKNDNEVIRQPCILMFDSLAGPSRWRIVSTLREYLDIEWKTKKGTQHIFDRDTMRGFTPKIPQQTNYSDCGVYVLQYVESFFKKPLLKFSSPLPNLEDWFTEENIIQKREELRTLILELQKSQTGNSETSSDSSSDSVPTSTVCLQGEESEQR